MRFLRRSLAGLFLTALTVGFLALAVASVGDALRERAARDSGPEEARERVFAANVVRFEPETVMPVLDTFGEILSRRTLEVRAAAPGRVVALGEGVEEGGSVAAGDLLVRVDPADAQRDLAVARTDLQDAEAELRDAKRAVGLAADDLAAARTQASLRQSALDRQRNIQSRGIGSAAAVEEAELAEAAAEQAVVSRRQAQAQAEARLDQARTALSRQRIAVEEAERAVQETVARAAFSGVLSGVSVVEGGLVSVNEQMMQLVDPQALEIAFRISTAQYARLLDEEGRLAPAHILVALETGGITISTTGVISRESAVVGEGQTGRRLYATLENPAGFRAGDFAAVGIEEPPLHGVARLPAEAVDSAGRVLVLGADDRLEAAQVEIARRQGDEVLVRAAELAGRDVVSERAPQLGVGIKVRPQRVPDADAIGEAAQDSDDLAEMLELSEERRARLVAFVEGSEAMPVEAKERVLAQLREARVPAQVVARIEQRMGG